MRSVQVMTVDDCAVSRRVVKLLLRDQPGIDVVAKPPPSRKRALN